MSEYPSSLQYTKTHEWVRLENDDTVTVGISDFAQDQLGDIVYVELPVVGETTSIGEEIAVVESVKAASDIYAPVSGEIVEVNDALEEEPEIVNSDPFIDGWLFVIRPNDRNELELLYSADYYQTLCETEEI